MSVCDVKVLSSSWKCGSLVMEVFLVLLSSHVELRLWDVLTYYNYNYKSLCLYPCTDLDIPVMKDLKIFAQNTVTFLTCEGILSGCFTSNLQT